MDFVYAQIATEMALMGFCSYGNFELSKVLSEMDLGFFFHHKNIIKLELHLVWFLGFLVFFSEWTKSVCFINKVITINWKIALVVGS